MKTKFILFPLLLLVLCLFLNINEVKAIEDVDYYISNYDIVAQVQEDGSMVIEEYITMDGSFNGFYKTIHYNNITSNIFNNELEDFRSSDIYNCSSVTDIEIRSFNTNTKQLSKEFIKVEKANKGSNDVYEYSDNGSISSFKIYNESDDSIKGFYIKYTLTDIVVIHNDCAEILWSFLSTSFEDDIDNLSITVSLYKESELFEPYYHGQLNGNIKKIDNSKSITTVKNYNNDSFVNIRLMFDSNIITTSNKISNVNAIDSITEFELIEHLRVIDELKHRENIVNTFSVIVYSLIVINLFLLFIFNKISKEKVDVSIYDNLPKDISNIMPPDTTSFFYNRFSGIFTNISIDNALSSCILELIRKRALIPCEYNNDDNEKEHYYTKGENYDELTESESFLFSSLMDNFSNDNKLYLNKLNEQFKDTKLCTKYNEIIKDWTEISKNKIDSLNLFSKIKHSEFIGILSLFSIVLAIVAGINYIINLFEFDFIYLAQVLTLTFISLINLILYLGSEYKNKDCILLGYKINGFREYIRSIEDFNDHVFTDDEYWDKTIVYAVALGLSVDIDYLVNLYSKSFNTLENNDGSGNTLLYLMVFSNFNINNSITKSFTSINSTVSATTTGVSGFSGGGFSGGSGGGGF